MSAGENGDDSTDDTEPADTASFDELLETAREAVNNLETDPDPADFDTAIEAIETALTKATTEAHLDALDDAVDDTKQHLEDADIPEPESDDDPDPRDEIEDSLDDITADIEDHRGPYAEDVTNNIEDAIDTITETRWTDTGEPDVLDTVRSFITALTDHFPGDLERPETFDAIPDALESAIDLILDQNLDPDDDADTIATLLDLTDELTTGLDDAEEWDDLTTREQLDYEGFYDVLNHRKDFPPELNALKVWERRARTDQILLALETLDIDFMEEHCLNALKRLGDDEALDTMLQRAQRRDKTAIEIIGKIGNAEATDAIIEYAEPNGDTELQIATIKALGEIGDTTATQTIANQLVHDDPRVRATAARSLGLIGDPRAIEPLATSLEDDQAVKVRGNAAWALRQIRTELALETLTDYTNDDFVLVKEEAKKARKHLNTTPSSA